MLDFPAKLTQPELKRPSISYLYQLSLNDVSVRREDWSPDDLLNLWFTPNGVKTIRSAQKLAQNNLQHANLASTRLSKFDLTSLPLSLFQLVLFRTVRRFARQFFGSNPTWISTPRVGQDKVDCSVNGFLECLASELAHLAPMLRQSPVPQRFLGLGDVVELLNNFLEIGDALKEIGGALK
jgi:hypothetical protein